MQNKLEKLIEDAYSDYSIIDDKILEIEKIVNYLHPSFDIWIHDQRYSIEEIYKRVVNYKPNIFNPLKDKEKLRNICEMIKSGSYKSEEKEDVAIHEFCLSFNINYSDAPVFPIENDDGTQGDDISFDEFYKNYLKNKESAV